MNKLKYFFFATLLLAVFAGCKKKDWRDEHIGSFNCRHYYEIPIIDFTSGVVSYYKTDIDSNFLNKNISVIKNDYADQYTVKVEGKYLMDVDKDGHCTLPNARFSFRQDTVLIYLNNLADTTRWGRYAYVGKKN